MTITNKPSKAMHISLWVVQVLLAAMFLMSGFMKALMPIELLSAMLPWATSVPTALVKFIGLSELLGGLGLLLPSLLRIKPKLTVWAGVGLGTIMVLAIPFHISRGETPLIGMNVIFMLLSLFVAWGRSKKAPILPKS
jgi:putative oxidoreductase